MDFSFLFQVGLHRFIGASLLFVFLDAAGIQDAAAVEYKASPIAGEILRNAAFFIGKTVDVNI